MTIDPGQIMAKLNKLRPGQSVVYYTGFTGWLSSDVHLVNLQRWFCNEQNSGKWIFMQRLCSPAKDPLDRNIFEYIAIKRLKPEPPNKVLNYSSFRRQLKEL